MRDRQDYDKLDEVELEDLDMDTADLKDFHQEDLELEDLDQEALDQGNLYGTEQTQEEPGIPDSEGKAFPRLDKRGGKRRRKGLYKEYLLAGGGLLLLLCALLWAGNHFLFRSQPGPEAVNESPGEVQPEQAGEPELSEEEKLAAEREAVVASYENLGIVEVTGYLNIRESASTDADVIGKLQDGGACSILETPEEGWYHISSGGIEGYISSEFVLTGSEARKKALENVDLRATVTADALNIRKEPDTEAEVVGQALKNEKYLVLGQSDGWIQIQQGYISADYAVVAYGLNEARKLDMKAMVLNLYNNLGISSVDSYLNIRKEPGESADIIGKMTSKSAGEILETTEDGEWYLIQSGPVTGYVKSDYILTGQAAKDEALNVAELMAIVSTDRLNVREEPSESSKIWSQISNNERYPVTEQMDGWVGIEVDTSTAYVSTDYVDVRYALPEAVKFSPLDENLSLRNKMVNYGLQFVGNRYVWGGNDPHTGADCSGFVKYVYSNIAGVSLPRVSREQARGGKRIISDQMRPGDLIFYAKNGTVNHVAMYIGNGQVVHAASRRSGIKISTWNYRTPYRIVNYLGD